MKDFTAARALQSDFLDSPTSKPTTFNFVAALPVGSSEPLELVAPIGADIDFPIAYTFQIPAAHVSVTRWIEGGMLEGEPFAWQGRAPERPGGGAAAVVSNAARFDPDALPWYRQLALYLRLGFNHIVPEGTDHILFVLGLFFLGITWRKLLSQTTVFTVAYATTLFLSTYGIFQLPSRYVEPSIALSIAYVSIENVCNARLSPARLTVVFAFGLSTVWVSPAA